MKIRCVNCGHNFELGDAYDDYEGEVKCWVCEAIMDINVKNGMMKSSRCVKTPHAVSEETRTA